jgi:hypothetical protein
MTLASRRRLACGASSTVCMGIRFMTHKDAVTPRNVTAARVTFGPANSSLTSWMLGTTR